MITARQVRAARALLDWTQQDLADKTPYSIKVITRFESGDVDPHVSTLSAIEQALIKGGVEFIPADEHKGDGVRMARAKG